MAQLTTGVNDLATIHPELALEWHPTRNGNLTPEHVAPQSHKKVWWLGKCGHEWEAKIDNRSRGKGCPYCYGRKAISGTNDLATVRPDLAAEWHPTKNGALLPSEVKAQSNLKVWWICDKKHEWKTSIAHRTGGSRCPVCWGESKTSFPEQAIWYYLQKVTAAENRNTDFGKEMDVWLPDLRVGIEYNGWRHDTEKKKLSDARKIVHLAEQNIRLITVKESDQNRIVGDVIEYIYHTTKKESLNWVIQSLFQMLNLPSLLVDCDTDTPDIHAQYIQMEKENSLEAIYPAIAAEWHPFKNGNLLPSYVPKSSNKKVWWICEHGHEWQEVINNRIKNRNCPYCSGHKVWPGFNDLATTHPELASEWHPTKNGDLIPQQINKGSEKLVWWICEKGHEWQARPYSRSGMGAGCPVCAGKKILPGFNDLNSICPNLSAQWHPTKNAPLTPKEVTVSCNKKIWWQCSKGHEWQTTIAHRSRGLGCPYCSGRRVIPGETDLATTHPELAKQWHLTKNGNLKPSDVKAGSPKKVWWQCPTCNHEWEASLNNRSKGRGCPLCAKMRRKTNKAKAPE